MRLGRVLRLSPHSQGCATLTFMSAFTHTDTHTHAGTQTLTHARIQSHTHLQSPSHTCRVPHTPGDSLTHLESPTHTCRLTHRHPLPPPPGDPPLWPLRVQ